VSPSSLRETWADAAHQWLGLGDARTLTLWKAADAAAIAARADSSLTDSPLDLVIVSYDLLKAKAVAAAVAAQRFQVVVCDESHFIKNPAVRLAGAERAGGRRGTAAQQPHR